MNTNLLEVTVANGKYTVLQGPSGAVMALRYGEDWRNCMGDGLVLALAQEVDNLRNQIEEAKACLVCVAIADSFEVCENTLHILNGEQSATT